ncbi:ribosomal protein L17, mitochondrial [Dictyostelium discoideum AX4]|uniref:Large ribosomal subunit protein bL17m n=1 Tax=Dictyostelium discoideum TaxID=44689 RepID=RM17_DICDI|nr:ribosomal protein L17, mitochondrial [Dictyostelium discoideum AX4]Q54TY5.1 RecName: Full=Large ribosomal subunit protein bL17m; AltName: Full=39S ribosomal protein L17, mitochondrial; Short=L17mt; Short=MRP-L17; Flags: Precursor [Dictyostelium discoideum]EAL66699.1 ribosomal protein L17, mitochondrial [Dictyostelium discoideum AX4]|eukprot:XP_640676.1 ribosomal protein L17, mitochondrial [Dictyostelium discoideum AX4]
MYHGQKLAKLGRESHHRMLMLRTMVTQLIRHERIKTTLAKAKALRKEADRIITIAKRNTRLSHSLVYSYVTDKQVIPKLFKELRLRFGDRPGGYTRVLKAGSRLSDRSKMAYIEYVENDLVPLRDYKANNSKFAVIRKPTPQGTVFNFEEKETGKIYSSAISLNNRFKRLEQLKKQSTSSSN